ncbi:MAG: extracellular solute-binding protein [Rhodobacteraceae bacterium]|nr:extracellular solute-binding protein [Paracoccaceae bacterium]
MTHFVHTIRRLMGRLMGLAVILGMSLGAGTGDVRADGAMIESHGISTFGNLKYAADFPHFDYVNPAAPKGGEISIAAQGSFDSMNPYARKGRAGALSSIMFESLLESNADEASAMYGLLAHGIEYPEDRSWITFHIRPEARFSDGTSVTADDVHFSYTQFLASGLQSFRAELGKAVRSVEVLGPLTIRFNFNTGGSTRTFPALVGGLPIFSEKWFEETGATLDESRLETPVGSGPYILDSMDVGKRITYRRRPEYWGWHLPVMQGRANFDRIRVEYFADPNAAFEAFKTGVYTFRSENQSKRWATAYDFPAITNGWVRKDQLHDGSVASGQSFVFNLRRPVFKDIRVREAIGLMFNFEWTNSTLFYGLYKRINSPWENSPLAASGVPEGAELALLETVRDLVPAEIFTEPAAMAPVSGERLLDRGNLRLAAGLLDAAGWTLKDGLRYDAGGTALRVEFLVWSADFERIINPYVENLRQLGVDAVLTKVDSAQYTERVRNHEFDIITSSFGFGYEPGLGLRQDLGSEHVDGVFNRAGLANAGVDRLIEAVLAAESSEDLAIAVRALDRVLRSLKFYVGQWYRDFHTVAYFDIFDHPEPLPPFDPGYLDFWWFDEAAARRLASEGAL